MNERGQIAVIILLFLLVALTIGLAVTQRSLTNITTSGQSEQSSRAFSAAEAGIQRSIAVVQPIVLSGPNPSAPPVTESELGNASSAIIKVVNNLPRVGEALEYPPIGKDGIAQFWLANPKNTTTVWNTGSGNFADPHFAYGGSTLKIYYGNANPVSGNQAPAIEINLVVQTGAGFISHRYFFDDPFNGRLAGNNFTSVLSAIPPAGAGTCSPPIIHTSSSVDATAIDRQFYCQVAIPITPGEVPILIRARILYSDSKEPIAVEPQGGCGINCSLPPQAAIYTSRGFSGQSQKTLQVFRQPFYLSLLLDFALFSAGPINKP